VIGYLVIKMWIFCLFLTTLAQYRFVTIPAIDLRSEMQPSPTDFSCCDPYQQTQLLFGECVKVIQDVGDWTQVEVEDQLWLSNGTFLPYPGYVLSSQLQAIKGNYRCDNPSSFNLVTNKLETPLYRRACIPGCITGDILTYLSIGTRLQQANVTAGGIDWISVTLGDGSIAWVLKADVNFYVTSKSVPSDRVQSIVATAHDLLGWVYFWGGRSAYDPRSMNQLTGVDCSGLVGISHLTNGVLLPRDADGQFYGSNHGDNVPIATGTLFFFADSSSHVDHVMLYVGDGYLIESTTSNNANATRIYPVQDRFGAPVEDLVYGMKVGSSILWWGDYFAN